MNSTTGFLYSLFLFVCLSQSGFGQSASEIADRFIDYSLENDTLQIKARLFVPESYDEQQIYPVVMTLHGSGECGTDNYKQILYNHIATTWGQDAFQAEHPCFIFSPQNPVDGDWAQTKVYESVMLVLDSLVSTYSIDTTRIYITGLSLGGYGTWSYLDKDPEKYSAALPMCGGYRGSHLETSEMVNKIRHIPVWNFHGNGDNTVDVGTSRKIIEKYPAYLEFHLYTHQFYRKDYSLDESVVEDYIRDYSELIYSEIPNYGHTVWNVAYQMPQVKSWLFQQRKHARDNISVNRQGERLKVSGTREFTFAVSGLTDSVSIWSGHINSADWEYVDRVDAAEGV